VLELINGMYVSGFIVRSLTPFEGLPLNYGVFSTLESAQRWAESMIQEVVIEPVYVATANRG
jgi:hypothetical protein